MIGSLRARLFFGMTVVIVLTGAIGGSLAYRWAYGEAIEMQDSVLMQIAAFATTSSLGKSQSISGIDGDAEVAVVELGTVPRGSVDDRHLWSLRDGLYNESYSETPIRLLLRTRADGSRFAVTQSFRIRSELAENFALRTLMPIATLVPCLMLVTAFVITRSFAPMMHVAAELDAGSSGEPKELAVAGAPSELHPFLRSINGMLRRMHQMMERQQRFIADAAHELRTPITALSLQADNLDPIDMLPAARDRLDALKRGMARTKRLLEQLLTMARQDTDVPVAYERAFLDRIAKEVVADLLPQAAAREMDLGFKTAEAILVEADPVSIASVVRNILENAIKFTPDGGTVDITICREGEWALFKVEDSGPGVPSGDLDRVFEPFFRSRSTVDGSGLGLSIVKRIVQRYAGSVRLANSQRDGRSGLSVTVKIPHAGRIGK